MTDRERFLKTLKRQIYSGDRPFISSDISLENYAYFINLMREVYGM